MVDQTTNAHKLHKQQGKIENKKPRLFTMIKSIFVLSLALFPMAMVLGQESTRYVSANRDLARDNPRHLSEDFDSDLPEDFEIYDDGLDSWFDQESDEQEENDGEEAEEFEDPEDDVGRKMMEEETMEAASTRGGRELTTTQPERFLLRFSDAYLVHVPGSTATQIITEGNVLSYAKDWEVKKMRGYLYHMRMKTWKGFYWKVNTSRRQVYMVRNGTFGQYGGSSTVLYNIGVDNVGSSLHPYRFFLRLKDAYLVHVPQTRTLQIAASGFVLSYGSDWSVIHKKSYFFQMRQYNWRFGQFYWAVNTSRKKLYRVKNGVFGRYGGNYEHLDDVTVQPVY